MPKPIPEDDIYITLHINRKRKRWKSYNKNELKRKSLNACVHIGFKEKGKKHKGYCELY